MYDPEAKRICDLRHNITMLSLEHVELVLLLTHGSTVQLFKLYSGAPTVQHMVWCMKHSNEIVSQASRALVRGAGLKALRVSCGLTQFSTSIIMCLYTKSHVHLLSLTNGVLRDRTLDLRYGNLKRNSNNASGSLETTDDRRRRGKTSQQTRPKVLILLLVFAP